MPTKKKKLKQYTIEVSDEGKQYDNFIGYYNVIATSKKHAYKLLIESKIVPSFVLDSAEINIVNLNKVADTFNIEECCHVSLLNYDCYN